MYIFEVSIDGSNKTSITWDQVIERVEDLAARYWNSGQTYCRDYPVFREASRVVWIAQTMEKCSLDSRYDSVWVKKYREELEKVCRAKLQIQYRGENPSSGKAVCRCKSPSWYVLFTNFATENSPLLCGDCGGYVPLYRIPKPCSSLDEKEYELKTIQDYSLIREWELNYQYCDNLQMDCGFAQRWGQRQLSDVRSGLSCSGRDLARSLESRLNAPVYYYLYNYKKTTYKADITRPCPVCKGAWFLSDDSSGADNESLFRFKCDDCRLVSNISFDLL